MDAEMEKIDPERSSSRAWPRAALPFFLIAALGAAIAVGIWGYRPRDAGVGESGESAQSVLETSSLGTVPSFTLTDQEGRRFDASRLAGKVWVASFIFTSCAASCPLMTAKFRELQDVLGADPLLKQQVMLVSFSVDPERDTPERLREFGKRYGAEPGLWWFLTGEKGAVARLSREGFHLAADSSGAQPADGESPPPPDFASHSDRFVLVDREGKICGYYRPSSEAADQERLLRDLRRLVAQRAAAP